MNIVYAMQNVASNISNAALTLIHNNLFLGFLVGYAGATIMYVFLISENPHHIPTMMTNSKNDSFQKLAERDENGKYLLSYTTFERDFNRLRIVTYSMLTVFLVVFGICISVY